MSLNDPAVSPVMAARALWDLRADPARLDAVAASWETFASTGDTVATDLDSAARRVFDDGWAGDTRESYESHVKKVRNTLADFRAKAMSVAAPLRTMAEVLRAKQYQLTCALARMRLEFPHAEGDGTIRFLPADTDQRQRVVAGIAEARTIRQELDTVLGTEAGRLGGAVEAWRKVSGEWANVTSGFIAPPEPLGVADFLRLPDGSVVVNGSTGGDVIRVDKGPTGETVVTVNNRTTTFAPGTPVTVRGGEGLDWFYVGNGAAPVTVLGGEDRDMVSVSPDNGTAGAHTVITGNGADSVYGGGHGYVSTGDGDDTVSKGAGDDTVYTGDGDDKVYDSGGDNHVSTGRGDATVKTGAGRDTVFAASADGGQIISRRPDTAIEVGEGDDTVVTGAGRDEVYGGKGADTVYGGGARDYIDGQDGDDVIEGGMGDDIIYGLNGDDTMSGGDGRDHLEGGRDRDRIDGGSGDDVVSGGRGDDDLSGGTGDDKLYGGLGKDRVSGDDGYDDVYVQNEDVSADPVEVTTSVDIPDTTFFEVRGSEEFKERIQADLDLFASSPTGSRMVENLGDRVSETHHDLQFGEKEIVIKEYDEANGSAKPPNGTPWGDVNIRVNPEHAGDDESTPVVLYHELAHAYDRLNSTVEFGDHVEPSDPDWNPSSGDPVPQRERQAVGLPIHDTHDRLEKTYEDVYRIDSEHPIPFTENGIRDEFGLDRRTQYGQAEKPVRK